MKKTFGFTLLSIATFMLACHSVGATTYKYENWTFNGGYGTATKVDENVTNLKGETTPTNGMYNGPYSKASTAKLADEGGIVEEAYVELDPEKIADGEYFEASLALKNGNDEYVSEAVVMTQRVGDKFKLTSSWAPDFEAYVSAKGVYTYQWNVYTEEGKTYVNFVLLQGNRELGTTNIIDFDTIVTPDTKNPIADQPDVSVKYLWFCNINVANGVNVYATLPTVNLTFVDPTEEENIVLEVFKYAAFTEEEVEELLTELKNAAKEAGYAFEGFYTDEDYTTEFDMTKVFDQDTTVYLKVSELANEENSETKPEETVKPPKTGDINLYVIISLVIVSIVGAIFASRKIAQKVK